jgi:hypothetical protein
MTGGAIVARPLVLVGHKEANGRAQRQAKLCPAQNGDLEGNDVGL